MAEHIEVETQELQEKIDEVREEQEREEKSNAWVRYVGLSTALLAVFAAIGALQSGNLINEALIHTIKASDTWNEYQASRQKDHLYTLALNGMLDANLGNAALNNAMSAPAASPAPAKPAEGAEAAKPAEGAKPEHAKPGAKKEAAPLHAAPMFASKPVEVRAVDYRAKILAEMSKEDSLSSKARELEDTSEEEIRHHHSFEYSVALIQVAIALGAVSALSRAKMVWYLSMLVGLCGIGLFGFGFLP